MEQEAGVVRSVQWRELCTWIELFRIFRVSVGVPLLLLGFAGAWATSAGWNLAGQVFLSDEMRQQPPIASYLAVVDDWPATSQELAPTPEWDRPLWSVLLQSVYRSPLAVFVQPMLRLFAGTDSWSEFLFVLLGVCWNLLIWGIIGGAISRIAAVRFGRDERVGLRDALAFSISKLTSFIAAPLIPLLAVLMLSIPIVLLGLVMRASIGVAFAGVIWPLAVIPAVAMSLFVVGILFGWPLMWPAISTEGSDAFDAISRSFAYSFQRPLHYLIYAVAAYVLGLLGWCIVSLFCISIVEMSMTCIHEGMGASQWAQLQAALSEPASTESVWLWSGGGLIGFFNRCVLGVQRGYAFSFLWVAATCIYLLLRKSADQTELDDVYVPEDDHVSYGLPTLKPDESGVPIVTETGDETSSDAGNESGDDTGDPQ